METTESPPVFTFANGQPSSPPMTPGSRTHPRFPSKRNHSSPGYKRMSLGHLAQSPPLEFIKPIGQGPQFHFTRPQSRDPSSRPSTASGPACETTPQDSEDADDDDDDDDEESDDEESDDEESDDESAYEEVIPFRRAEEADINFVLEELDSDPSSGYDSDIEVVRPDHFEDAKSEKSASRVGNSEIIDKIKQFQLEDDSSDEERKQMIYRKKKKRWSTGIYKIKRTYSMSVEGDSSYSDNDPLDDVDESARRLRRRVRGPGDRSSLVFEDRGFSNANNIAEVEEPEDGRIVHTQGPPSIPSDDAFTLDELPFCHVEEWMEVESVY